MKGMEKVRNLPVVLTELERKQRAERLAECVQRRSQVQDEKRTHASIAYRELKNLDAEIAALSDVVSTGTEVREVEVEERKDLSRRVLEIVRKDTSEIVDSRQLSIEELQDDLPFQRSAGERSTSYYAEDEDGTVEAGPERKRKRSPKSAHA